MHDAVVFFSWFFGIAFVLIAISAYSTYRNKRKAGLKSVTRGYSAKIDVVAARLKEHVQAVENAMEFGKAFPYLPWEFESAAKDSFREASVQDRSELVPYLFSALQQGRDIGRKFDDLGDEAEERGETQIQIPESLKQTTNEYLESLRKAAGELEQYAESVRARGGLFHQPRQKLAGCIVYLCAYTAGGIYLIYNFRADHTWPYWLGWGIVCTDLLFAIGLYRMQSEPA